MPELPLKFLNLHPIEVERRVNWTYRMIDWTAPMID